MEASARLPRLRDVPSFSQEVRTALRSLGIEGRRQRLSRGSMVSLHEGGPHAGLHLLLDGRMKTVRFSEDGRVILLEILDRGDVFGEMALVYEEGGEPTYAEALEDVEIETFARFALDGVLRGRSALALALARLVVARCKRMERRLEAQIFQRVPARLAHLLMELADRFGEPEGEGSVIDVPLSQQDLANLIGASREIVSLTLSEFRRREAISMRGRRIVIHESKLLREADSAS